MRTDKPCACDETYGFSNDPDGTLRVHCRKCSASWSTGPRTPLWPPPPASPTERELRNAAELARLRAASPAPAAATVRGPLGKLLGAIAARLGGARTDGGT